MSQAMGHHMHVHAQDPVTGESFCGHCEPDRPILVLVAPDEWKDARRMTPDELSASEDFVRGELKRLGYE